MNPGYWQQFSETRISRRRGLAAGSAAALGAAFLAACGGGSSGTDSAPKEPADKSGLISTPSDTTAQAKPGGTFKGYRDADVPNGFDVLATNNAQTQSVAIYA